MILSRHFNLGEFAYSQTAARLGRPVEIPAEIVPAIQALVTNVLEPLRSDVRRSVWIMSGYRPAWLNKAVGGAAKSSHLKGEAADIQVSGLTPRQVMRRVIALELPFDQLILEFDQWVHVSHSRSGNRSEVLTARKVGGQTRYFPGILED